MALIDKIGEKITSGANAVSVSTKRVTESARINGEISANSAEIDKLMKKLGICVKSRLMPQINDPEAEQIAAEIDRYIARNEELATELQKVKGIRRCEKCSAELPQNSIFCPNCGTRSEPVINNANQQVKTQVKVKSAAAPCDPQPTADQQPAAAGKSVFCTVCGYHETDGGAFCSNCGSKLSR